MFLFQNYVNGNERKWPLNVNEQVFFSPKSYLCSQTSLKYFELHIQFLVLFSTKNSSCSLFLLLSRLCVSTSYYSDYYDIIRIFSDNFLILSFILRAFVDRQFMIKVVQPYHPRQCGPAPVLQISRLIAVWVEQSISGIQKVIIIHGLGTRHKPRAGESDSYRALDGTGGRSPLRIYFP